MFIVCTILFCCIVFKLCFPLLHCLYYIMPKTGFLLQCCIVLWLSYAVILHYFLFCNSPWFSMRKPGYKLRKLTENIVGQFHQKYKVWKPIVDSRHLLENSRYLLENLMTCANKIQTTRQCNTTYAFIFSGISGNDGQWCSLLTFFHCVL